MKTKQGGYLIMEMVIYIALFSILIGGLFVAVFQIMDSTRDTSGQVVTEDEMNFVIKKMDYLLTGVETITTPVSGTSNTLTFTKGGATYIIRVDSTGKYIETCKNTSCSYISTGNVSVTAGSLSFQRLGGAGIPDGVKTTITIDGKTASFSKYKAI